MPRPFNHEFLSLYRKKPFADEDRVNLRHFVEALRRQLGVDDLGFALDLDGINDYAQIVDPGWGANEALNITGEISIEFWAYWENVGVDVDIICCKGANTYQVATGAAANNSLVFTPLAGTTVTSGLNTFPSNQWNHVVVTWNDVGPVGRIYVNGVNTGAAVIGAGPIAGNAANWFWGQGAAGANPFEGWLDECRVWGRELSQAEVTELYNAGVGYYMDAEMLASGVGYDYELRGYWRWDEGAGVLCADSSGNSGDADLMLGAAWIAGHLEVPDCFTTVADRVYDAIFVPTARNLELDEWGEGLDVARAAGESDPTYRGRLEAQMQLANNCLTVQAVEDCVDTIGTGYAPVITAVRTHEYYKGHYGEGGPDYGRRADGPVGGPAAADECLGEIHGLDDHDYLTFGVELNRSPSVAEAWELVNGDGVNPGLYEIKAAQTRAHVITDMGLPNPPRYRMYSYCYSLGLAPLSWEDNFNHLLDVVVTDYYNVVVGAGGGWSYSGAAPFTLIGVAVANTPLADVIVPRQDLPDYKVVVDEYNVYVYAKARFTAMGMPTVNDFAGFVFRYQDATDEFYAVVFRDNGVAWEYSIQRFTGAAWVVEKAWAVTGIDMSVWREIEMWVRDESLFTLRIDGAVIINEHDVGPDITDPGEFGFVTAQVDVDIEVEEWRYW